MKLVRCAATVAFSAVLAGAGVFAQQTPPPATRPSAQPPSSQTGLQALDGQTVTVTGCVMREASVPGQEPSVAERAGIMRDFILTNVQVKSASPSGAAPGAPSGTGAMAPSAGASSTRVKLTNIDNDKIEANLNRQIEVTGRLDVDDGMNMAGDRPGRPTTAEPPTAGRDATRELAELNVQSVRALNQPCPTKQ